MSNAQGDLGPIPGGVATRVEALGYRSLSFVAQALAPFQVLVGPNASGKSTFLDVLAFLGDIVRVGVQGAVEGDARFSIPHRAADGKDLTWMRAGSRIELAAEFSIPAPRLAQLKNGADKICRYEVAIEVTRQLQIVGENLWLKARPPTPEAPRQRQLFPQPPAVPDTIVRPPRKHTPPGWQKVLSRGDEPERVMFAAETSGWTNPFRISSGKAALASLPEDEEKFPVATWFRQTIANVVQRLVLSSEDMRRPCPPGRTRGFLPDGSNLPLVVHQLQESHPERFGDWVRHVREALPDLRQISTRERAEDRHRYLVLEYETGLEAPSWLVSDGTLRLLALTLLAYVPEITGTYLVEEPENGIHPRAVETVFQSLSSVYGAQVLLATHSPVVLSLASLDQVLCFARTSDGATDVVPGRQHPRLRDWKGDTDLGTLLAAGVLS